jgi:hypothetical protein
MNIKYESIVDANKGIEYTDVRGKNYAEVAQRVQAFRKLIPGGYITTDIISNENGVVYMKAEAGYYENGQRVMLATGLAFERQDASNINKTSYIENCETSAVGRALGFIGFGSEKSIASAEEVDNAIKTQEAIESGAIVDPTKQRQAAKPQAMQTPPAQVTTAAQIPKEEKQTTPVEQTPPVLSYLAKEREALRVVREIGKAENNAIWKAQIQALTDARLAPAKPLAEFTQQEAESLIAAMYKNFAPKGTVLKNDGKIA